MGHIGKHSSRVTAEWLEPQVLGEGMESRLRSKVMTLSGKKKGRKHFILRAMRPFGRFSKRRQSI